MQQNERQPGYYRVKINGKWDILEWGGEYWFRCGSELPIIEGCLSEIDETPIDPRPQTESSLNKIAKHYGISQQQLAEKIPAVHPDIKRHYDELRTYMEQAAEAGRALMQNIHRGTFIEAHSNDRIENRIFKGYKNGKDRPQEHAGWKPE